MKWLSKWLFKMTKEGSRLSQQELEAEAAVAKYANASQPESIGLGRSSKFEQSGMNFTLFKANGGYVMEYRSYNPTTDRASNRLHIITADQDLGQQISHIITFEALQQ